MAMLGKRFQRTISMSQMGPGSSFHTEKVQVQLPHQQQLKGEQHAEYQPAQQWEVLKTAEAMVMMMMANSSSGANDTAANGEELGLQLPSGGAAVLSAEQYPVGYGYPANLILSTDHFLDSCFSCKCRLRPERDIFIYRGDAAFCTEECRNRQILTDKMRTSRASKKGGDASVDTAVAV